MQRRAEALEILHKLRESLADRMSERIIDSVDDLIDDALGESYRGEIDLLYEQYGAKLVLINQIIGNFPVNNIPQPPPHFDAEEFRSEDLISSKDFASYKSLEVHYDLPESANPSGTTPPKQTSLRDQREFSNLQASDFESTWGQFLRQIRSRDILAAGEAFGLMSALPMERAELAASHFLARCDQDAGFFDHARQLVEDVRLASVNDALEILYGSFGLEGNDALATLVSFRPFLARELSTSQDMWE